MIDKTPGSAALRLSAIRAFMGEIGTDIRLIKIFFENGKIVLEVIFEEGTSETSVEAARIAGTEIIADFSDLKIEERFKFTDKELPKENIIASGWIYCRKEI